MVCYNFGWSIDEALCAISPIFSTSSLHLIAKDKKLHGVAWIFNPYSLMVIILILFLFVFSCRPQSLIIFNPLSLSVMITQML